MNASGVAVAMSINQSDILNGDRKLVVLGIESTCDETAASVVIDGVNVASNAIATQFELHEVYRGVVPEIASRAHIQNILPVVQTALSDAGVGLNDLDAVAVANRPGLIGSLLIGLTAAKTLAWSIGKPLVGVDHVQAHLYSVALKSSKEQADATPEFPAIGLVCSGGHTAIYLLNGWSDVRLLGKTIDDAVGEAYDKVAAILGLGFPGGPIIDRLAVGGRSDAYDFPRSTLGRESLDFSFSGLKTAVLYAVRGYQGRQRDPSTLTDADRADVAASFQQACVDILLKKLRRAIDRNGARSVIIGGGVSANRGLRAAVPALGVPVFVPALPFCTDNAAMIAGLGGELLRAGVSTGLELDAVTSSAIVR
jgi:N6-L-threonylcarbamoyladenine synthase